MMYIGKPIVYCLFLILLYSKTTNAKENFENAETMTEFITMSFSSSHPYDLRHTIPGEPDIDYPIYSEVPKTNFDCNGRHEGYYADTESRCQVFRICTNTDLIGKGFAFLCPNGTLFSQKHFVCDWYRNVECNESEKYYSKNDGNRIGSTNDMMKIVKQMMEHPMKTINKALNMVKISKPKAAAQNNFETSTAKVLRTFRTTPASVNTPSVGINEPVSIEEVENPTRFLKPRYQQNRNQKVTLSSPNIGGTSLTPNVSLTITPPSPTFLPPIDTSFPPTYENQDVSENSNSEAPSPSIENPSITSEGNADEKEVYISSLGELSTDPGSNFNPHSARIIAESPSNALDSQVNSASSSQDPSQTNFAKVNAGLHGVKVVNPNEVIAPEYVKNIVQQNLPIPDKLIKPPAFDFASNINSLLDEVSYDAELEGQNSVNVQLRAHSKQGSETTKKPFRFLSRGFSFDNRKDDGSYTYAPAASLRRTSSAAQHVTSTESYSSSLPTKPLLTTKTLISSTEASADINVSEEPLTLSVAEVNSNLDPNSQSTKDQIQSENNLRENIDSRKIKKAAIPKEISTLESDIKPTVQTEQKEDETQEAANNKIQDSENGEKADANKRAENLLLAGVKQVTVDNLNEGEQQNTSPIVPIYNRVTPSTQSISKLPATVESTTPLTTTKSTTASTTESTTTFSSTTTTDATTTPSSTTTQSIRRFKLGNRRIASRPNSIRRNNSLRSGPRNSSTTSTTTATPATSTSATFRPRSGRRTTSTTSASATITTSKPTASIRRRLNADRQPFGSRRRNTSTSSSTSTTSTTAAPANKKISVRSSDAALSDLTAVASTYSASSNRAYNSIRQNSYKYSQTARKRPTKTKNEPKSPSTTVIPILSTTTEEQITSFPSTTPNLAPFPHEASSLIPIVSTSPAPLPATYLSFNDLTKSITDDSILQTLKRNQDQRLNPVQGSGRNQQYGPFRQQFSIPMSADFRNAERTTSRPLFQQATSLPFVPLKDFIASKFGSQYSPLPPKLSTVRPTISPNSDLQYPKPQYTIRQNYVPQTVKSSNLPAKQNFYQQQPQFTFSQQQQSAPQQSTYQNPQLHNLPFIPTQPVSNRFPQQQQTFQRFNQQQQNHQPALKVLSSIEQQLQQQQITKVPFQQNQQQIPQQQVQQRQQSQIQIFPSHQMAVQTILPQQQSSISTEPEVRSINVRLPSNFAGLIPNTNTYESRLSGNSLDRAQRRSDQYYSEPSNGLEGISSYSGLSSYDVPLSSVGRLTNDITNLLRKRRL